MITDIFFYDISSHVYACIVPMIMAGGAAIANGILGSISAQKQKRDSLRALRKAENRENNWFNRHYNQDATQTADAQRLLTLQAEKAKKATQAAQGKNRVIGGTDAQVSAVQQGNAAAQSNTMSSIAANAAAKKDAMAANHEKAISNINAQRDAINSNYQANVQKNLANAASGLIKAASYVDPKAFKGSGSKGEKADSAPVGTPDESKLEALDNRMHSLSPADPVDESLDDASRRMWNQ